MLLVITLSHDRTMNLVTGQVNKPVIRLNIDDSPMMPFSFSWDGVKFSHTYRGFNLSEVTSVWYRIAYLTYLKEKPASYDMLNRLCREEMVHQLSGVLSNAFWVSDPHNIKRAENKQLQLEVAKGLGMSIPITLVTSSQEEVQKFREENGQIIVKPLAKQVIRDESEKLNAIFTNRIAINDQIDLSLLPNSPAIFQKEIDREFDIRTVVVGSDVFSISIRQIGSKAGGVDYRDGRGKDLEYARYQLPKELKKKCVSLVEYFGLRFSSMDFILGVDGNHYFLENNPCGAWLFVQNGGNHPIAEKIAELLN